MTENNLPNPEYQIADWKNPTYITKEKSMDTREKAYRLVGLIEALTWLPLIGTDSQKSQFHLVDNIQELYEELLKEIFKD